MSLDRPEGNRRHTLEGAPRLLLKSLVVPATCNGAVVHIHGRRGTSKGVTLHKPEASLNPKSHHQWPHGVTLGLHAPSQRLRMSMLLELNEPI